MYDILVNIRHERFIENVKATKPNKSDICLFQGYSNIGESSYFKRVKIMVFDTCRSLSTLISPNQCT